MIGKDQERMLDNGEKGGNGKFMVIRGYRLLVVRRTAS